VVLRKKPTATTVNKQMSYEKQYSSALLDKK